MGYCTRCGAVVGSGDRCRCGGRSKASTTNALFGESSARDKWSQRYLSKSPSASPTSTPPPQIFPLEQRSLPGAFPTKLKIVATAPLNLHKRTKSLKAYQDHVDKIGTVTTIEDADGELNVFGNLLSPSDCWSCCTCEVKFKSEDTIYPDPGAKQNPKLAEIFYCRQCFAQRFSLGDCKRCKCAVLSDAPFIQHGPNLLWHDSCFVCTYCSVPSSSSSIIIDMAGAPSCESCFDSAAYETHGVPPSPHLSRTPSIISATGERRERKLSLRPAPSKWGSGSGSTAPPYISALQKREQDEREALSEPERKLGGIVGKNGSDSRSYQPSPRSLPLPKPPAPRPGSLSALANPSTAWNRTKKERDESPMVGSFNELTEKLQKVGLGTGVLTPRTALDSPRPLVDSPRKSAFQSSRPTSPTKPVSTFSAPKSYGVLLPAPIRAERSPMTGAYPKEERRTDTAKARPKSWHVPAEKPISAPPVVATKAGRPLSVLERRQLFTVPSETIPVAPSPIRHTRNADSLSAFSAFAAPPKYPFPDTTTSSKKDPLPPSTFSSPVSFPIRPRSKSVAFSQSVQKSPEIPWSAGKAALRSTVLAPPQYIRAATTNSIPRIQAPSPLLPKVPQSTSSSNVADPTTKMEKKHQWRPTSIGKSLNTILKPVSVALPSPPIASPTISKPPPMSMKEKMEKELTAAEPTHCGKCEQELGYEGKFIQLDSRKEVYHQDCFRCEKCRDVLEGGKYFEGEGGFVWHIHCAPTPTVHRVKVPLLAPEISDVEAKKRTPVAQLGACQSCGVGFVGNEEERIVTIPRTNRSFHQDCFNCAGCEKGFASLRGGQMAGFVEVNGLPWHDRCAPTQRIALLPTTSSLAPVRTSRSPSPASRPLPTIPQPPTPTTAAKSYQPPSIFASPTKISFSPSPLLICPSCSLRVVNAFSSVVGPKGKKYHSACLKCSACSKALDSGAKELEGDDGVLVCADCRGMGGRRLRR